MTGSDYLLDTNIISALFKGETAVAVRIDEAASVYIPIILAGEICYGSTLANNSARYINDLERLKALCPVLLLQENTCRHYASIKAGLRRKGRPIPENDIWTAAIAMQNNLIVAIRDQHFYEIEGIAVEEW